MARKKRGLQKDVSSIFAGVALQDVIHQGLSQDPGQPAKTLQEESPSTAFTPIDFPAQEVALAHEASQECTIPQEQEAVTAADLTKAPELSDEVSRDDRVQQLMASVPCTKDHSCVQSNLANLCKAKLGRKGTVVQCLEGKKHACSFRLSFLFKKICRCPIRQYIAKRWGK
jgi:hypothetical protein